VQSLQKGFLGVDLGPIDVGGTFCNDLQAGSFSDAYGLFTSGFQSSVSAKEFIAAFAIPGFTWTCSAPNLNTYVASNTSAHYDMSLTVISTLSSSVKFTVPVMVKFALTESGWQIASLDFHNR